MSDWWRGAIIYQIYPRSFQDDTGDGIGDLPGITRRLPHVASLGVDAIWLSPFFPSPMADMGYDVANYTDVDPLFGTLADFKALLETAHSLGLKVIIDQVLSHSSDQHPWFTESRKDRTNPKANWYVWADPKPDGCPPNNWASVFGGPAWEWEPRRRQYYLHNFLIEQPDLNFHEPQVQEALLEAMKFWLDLGVDGFRLDTVNFYTHNPDLTDNPPVSPEVFASEVETHNLQQHVHSKNQHKNLDFIERTRALTDAYGARMMVGEIGDKGELGLSLMADYTRGDDRLHMAYSFELLSPQFSAAHFRSALERFKAAAPDGWPCWSFSNHDVMRHVSRWAGHGVSPEALAKQAIALLLSFEGSIGLYQGEELGQLETEMEYHELTDPPGLRFWPEVKGRDGCRTPMVWEAQAEFGGFSEAAPWLPVKAAQAERAVSAQGAGSVLEHYRAMIALRQSNPALKTGRTRFLDLPEPVLGLVRGEALTCLFNLSPTPVRLMGSGTPIGLTEAALHNGEITLPGNGWVYLDGTPKIGG